MLLKEFYSTLNTFGITLSQASPKIVYICYIDIGRSGQNFYSRILLKNFFIFIKINFILLLSTKQTTAQCGPGTFQSVITKKCEKCPTGTYQPEAGKTSCLHCPEGSIIKGGENKNFTSCKGKVCFYMKTMRLLH